MNNNPFPKLHKQQFINLTTYRRSGQPVVTSVWEIKPAQEPTA